MLWFTGSSTKGLPFIHDSFPANPKAVHHRSPRFPPPLPEHHDFSSSSPVARTAADITDGNRGGSGGGKEFPPLDAQSVLRLPALESGAGPLLSSRSSAEGQPPIIRGERGKEPSSFTSYMHRFKACARLKGISPARTYCATRMRSTPSSDHPTITTSTTITPTQNPSSTPKDTLPLSSTPRLPDLSKPSDAAGEGDPASGEASAAPAPQVSATSEVKETTPNEERSMALERQVEEKLKQGALGDDGMARARQTRGRGRGRWRGRGGDRGSTRGQGGSGGGGGSRPLGDIVSPRRLQQLLVEGGEGGSVSHPFPHHPPVAPLEAGSEQPHVKLVDLESRP